MSKKNTKKLPSNYSNLQEKSVDLSDQICTFIIILYLLVEMSPKLEIQDQMGVHWLMLSILNFVSLVYVIINKTLINHSQLKSIFKNLTNEFTVNCKKY